MRRVGYDVVRYTPLNIVGLRRQQMLAELGVTVVLDVGGNIGTYGRRIRESGYTGRIVSFEPIADAYAQLAAAAGPDPDWEARRIALGARDGGDSIVVAADSRYSSLLPMASRYVHDAVAAVASEEIQIQRLDSVAPGFLDADDRIFVKLDVQGFELEVLRGANRTLGQVVAIEAELSTRMVYVGQPLLHEVVAYLYDRGFEIVSLEPVAFDRGTGYLRQVDALLTRMTHTARTTADG